ncbi:MAG: NAD(P)-binding protein [Caldilineaceae bacterium]
MNNSNATYDIIVIGSGIGGLTFASLMAQMQHKRVLVLERHFKLGGFTHAFSRPGGYTWDVGLHYVGNMRKGEMGRQIFDLITGGAVEWTKMPSPFERFVYPDFTFAVPDDRKAYQQALIAKFPSEQAAIRQYFKDLEKLGQWFARYTMMQAGASPLITWPMRLATAPDKLALMTTGAYLDQRFRDPQLKAPW